MQKGGVTPVVETAFWKGGAGLEGRDAGVTILDWGTASQGVKFAGILKGGAPAKRRGFVRGKERGFGAGTGVENAWERRRERGSQMEGGIGYEMGRGVLMEREIWREKRLG